MPYIKDENDKRIKLDEIVQLMHELDIKADGDLNYILFRYCRKYIKPSYNNYKNFIAELTECGREIARRLLSSYEDMKIQENGDVF